MVFACIEGYSAVTEGNSVTTASVAVNHHILLTWEKGQEKQESSKPDQRDKSTESVQQTVINKTTTNQGSKEVNIIQGKTFINKPIGAESYILKSYILTFRFYFFFYILYIILIIYNI